MKVGDSLGNKYIGEYKKFEKDNIVWNDYELYIYKNKIDIFDYFTIEVNNNGYTITFDLKYVKENNNDIYCLYR